MRFFFKENFPVEDSAPKKKQRYYETAVPCPGVFGTPEFEAKNRRKPDRSALVALFKCQSEDGGEMCVKMCGVPFRVRPSSNFTSVAPWVCTQNAEQKAWCVMAPWRRRRRVGSFGELRVIIWWCAYIMAPGLLSNHRLLRSISWISHRTILIA